jgi:hypothetical protein
MLSGARASRWIERNCMEMSWRELVTAMHGMLFGGFFLMACFGLLVGLYRSLATGADGERTPAERRWDGAYLIVMVLLGWAAVLSGAYLVYPWYRAALPAGTTDLNGYPQRLLLAHAQTAGWHSLGMEWKEHVAWFAPMLMTMAAWVLMRCEGVGVEARRVRRTVAICATAALVAAGLAAGWGAMINKQAPVKGGAAIELMRGVP